MKKVLLIAALAVFGLTNVNAQDIGFGVKAGANFASFSGSDVPDAAEMKVGFHLGVLAEFKLGNQFAVQPELLYTMRGTQTTTEILGQSFDAKMNLSYLSVPILAKYYITENLNIHLGPQIGFLMSAKVSSDGNDVDVKDQYKSIDAGLAVGLGYKLDSGIFFDARYYLGMTQLADTDQDVDVKNSVIQISVGYMF